jgi:hypothetical protein
MAELDAVVDEWARENLALIPAALGPMRRGGEEG